MVSHHNHSIKPWEIAVYGAVFLLALAVSSKFLTFDFRSRAQYVPANIHVETGSIGQPIDTNFYHAFAQGGEEQDDMLGTVIPEISGLKPKIIRIDHIFDYFTTVEKSNSTITCDFSRLDTVIKTIRQTGATPMLALSYMPKIMTQDGTVIQQPESWDDWTSLIKLTIEHVSGKNGLNLLDIYYEVWNEPDLSQFGAWKTYGNKNYLDLYHYASIGARQVGNANQFYLGGPVSTGLYKAWIDALLKSTDRIDFISWHTYNDDPFDFAKDMTNIRTWLSDYPDRASTAIVISEFGFNGNKDLRYGTSFAASYMAAVVRQLFDDPPKHLMSFQLKDGPNDSDGKGWGILTHETAGKKQKPRYGVYAFLDTMAGNRLTLTGEGSSVTALATKAGDVIKVLLIQYSPEQERSETASVMFSNLESGTYTLTQEYFQGVRSTVDETISFEPLVKTVHMPANSILRLELTKKNE